MRIRPLVSFVLLVGLVAASEEFFVTKTGNDFVIEGRYANLDVNELIGAEFRICVDYEASTPVLNDSKPYPTEVCGGAPATSKNSWWYVVHGFWDDQARLTIKYEAATQIWPENGSEYPGGHWIWNRDAMPSESDKLRLIQSHGVTNYGAKDLSVDMVDLVGSGSVHVRGVADGIDLHIRVSGTGFTLQQAYETENARSSEEESPIIDNDQASTPKTIDLEGFEEMPTDQDQTKGQQWRPIVDVPFIDYAEPVILANDKPNRGFVEFVMANDTDAEILEIDVDPQGVQTTTIVATIDKSEVEMTSAPITDAPEDNSIRDDFWQSEPLLSDPFLSDDEAEQERIIDYQLLYTIAIALAFAFLIFFVSIVVFRCLTWGKTDKLGDLPVVNQRSMVYTIGGEQRGNSLP